MVGGHTCLNHSNDDKTEMADLCRCVDTIITTNIEQQCLSSSAFQELNDKMISIHVVMETQVVSVATTATSQPLSQLPIQTPSQPDSIPFTPPNQGFILTYSYMFLSPLPSHLPHTFNF